MDLPSMDNLTLKGEGSKPSLTLTVDTPSRMSSAQLSFKGHTLLGKFGITGDETYCEDPLINKIISPTAQKALKGKDLGTGFDSAVKIKNYSSFHEKKQEFFFKWLLQNEYFKEGKKSPEFVCFGGRITDPLQTPLVTRFGKWEIFAAKYKGSIFLWDEKREGRDMERGRDKASFYGVAFEALMTGKDPAKVNEFQKGFVVQEASFGNHGLLLVNEIDGEDEKGDFVEVTVFKGASPKALQSKYFANWAQSVVGGVKQIVFGERDEFGRLLTITPMTLEETLAKAKYAFTVKKAYDFEDRLLSWISSHFAGNEYEDDPAMVKKFSWGGAGDRYVKCQNVEKGEILPFFPDWVLNQGKN